MPKFTHFNYNQVSVATIHCEAQLQPNSFDYALHHIGDNKPDLSILYPSHQNDTIGGRRPVYDPARSLQL